MRNIKDLNPNDVIHIKTKKEAKRIFNLTGFDYSFFIDYKTPIYINIAGMVSSNKDFIPFGSNITPASEFLPKKSKLKDEIANLDSRVYDNTNDIQALQSAFKILAENVDSLPSVDWGNNGVVKVNIPGLKAGDTVNFSDASTSNGLNQPEALLFEPTHPLTELPEKWCVKGDKIVSKWASKRFNCGNFINKDRQEYLHVNGDKYGFYSVIKESHTEISTEDFKRLVLKENVLEDNVWYIYKSGALMFNIKDGKGYGISSGDKEWCKAVEWLNYSHNGEFTSAFKEQIETALINEAKKRGFKEGMIIHSPGADYNATLKAFNRYKYDANANRLLYFYDALSCVPVFINGIWAEIIEPAIEEIDWSKPGQLLSHKQYNRIVYTDGKHLGGIFSGTLIVTDGAFRLGYDTDWGKHHYKLYTGEPITLSN